MCAGNSVSNWDTGQYAAWMIDKATTRRSPLGKKLRREHSKKNQFNTNYSNRLKAIAAVIALPENTKKRAHEIMNDFKQLKDVQKPKKVRSNNAGTYRLSFLLLLSKFRGKMVENDKEREWNCSFCRLSTS